MSLIFQILLEKNLIQKEDPETTWKRTSQGKRKRRRQDRRITNYNLAHAILPYEMIEAYNLGSQVSNEEFVKKAIELKADVLLVSQTVTQKGIHVKNLTNLVELLEAEGIRDKVLLICGGARINNELAKELGYDAGFGPGVYAEKVATYFIKQFITRRNLKK